MVIFFVLVIVEYFIGLDERTRPSSELRRKTSPIFERKFLRKSPAVFNPAGGWAEKSGRG